MEPEQVELLSVEPEQDAWRLLTPARRMKAQDICSFLLGDGRLASDQIKTVAELCDRFIDAGLPLDRYASVIRILHSTDIATVQLWERGAGALRCQKQRTQCLCAGGPQRLR